MKKKTPKKTKKQLKQELEQAGWEFNFYSGMAREAAKRAEEWHKRLCALEDVVFKK